MQIGFTQGILSYPTSRTKQVFLSKQGSYVSLQTANGNIDFIFAHMDSNYLFTEAAEVDNAWGPLLSNTDYWLYLDINPKTLVRTFGFTKIEPTYGTVQPEHRPDLHWFNTTTNQMYVGTTYGWTKTIRIFVSKVNNHNFTALGSHETNPFAGSQVGLDQQIYSVGRPLLDKFGIPIIRPNGTLVTSDDDLRVEGKTINDIKLEANLTSVVALENIAKFQVVKFVEFGKVKLATYDDLQNSLIAITTEDILINHIGTVCVTGLITNPNWYFLRVGMELWVGNQGLLTPQNSHLLDPNTFKNNKPPIAIVTAEHTIYFSQGLGLRGNKGETGTGAPLATDAVYGITKLSVPAADINNPIVVGDNDPRMLPYVHPTTHPSTMITTPDYGFVLGDTTQSQLQELVDRPLESVGNVNLVSLTTNDFLTWDGTNWTNDQIPGPAPLDYLDDLLDVAITTPQNNDVLSYTGTGWINDNNIHEIQNDVLGSGTFAINTTLAVVNNTPGLFGSSTNLVSLVVNEKGLTTLANNIPFTVATTTVDSYAMWACGYNAYGQVGTGAAGWTNTSSPIQVGSLTDWVQMSAGQWHVLAVKADNTLWAWGANWSGPLGIGNTVDKYSPVQVGLLTDWKQVSADGEHSTAIKTDGTLWTWGYNAYGQLGNGIFSWDSSSPTQIGTLTDWKQVSTGTRNSFAVKIDGTLWAWGDNSVGALGNGTSGNGTGKSSPIQIGALTDWSEVSGGGLQFCTAIKTDGTLWTWGANFVGQLGLGNVAHVSSPTQVGTLTNWKQISCGWQHAIAIKTDGTLWAWGLNTQGELGDGTRTNRSSPVQIGSLTDWSRVEAGTYHSAAIKTDGTLWTWGANWIGMLGDGTTLDRSSPVQVGSLTSWKDVACGYTTYMLREMPLPISKGGTSNSTANDAFNALAPSQSGHAGQYLTTDGANTSWIPAGIDVNSKGTLWTSGRNVEGQLGDGTRVNKSSPIQVGSLNNWKQVSSGNYKHAAAIKQDGTMWTWGINFSGQLGDGTRTAKSSPVQVGALTDWKQVSVGNGNVAAIKTNGTLWAWGYNIYGVLGDNTGAPKSSPVQIGSLTNWKQVSAYGLHIAAIKTDGTLWACGYNGAGQLGDGTRAMKFSPVQIGSLTNWKQVSVGTVSTAAIKHDGTLWAWGDNFYGQLGDGTTTSKSSPIQIGSLTDWREVHSGSSRTFAIKYDGTLWAWGDNGFGNLGDGTIASKSSPIQIGSLTNWKQVTSAQASTHAIKTDGTRWAWGYNALYGELGDGTLIGKSSPIQIGSLTDWVQIAGGYDFVAAIRRDGIIVPIEAGGTSNITANEALNALLPQQQGNNNKTLMTSGADTSWTTPFPPSTITYGYGQNSMYELGNNTTQSSLIPTRSLIVPSKQISAKTNCNLMIGLNGTLWTWGANWNGQLGDGTVLDRSSPIQIGSLTNWKRFNTGLYQPAAIKTDGTLWAWGLNDYGQIGDGTIINKSSPVQVGLLSNWKQSSGGLSHSAAIKTDGTLWTWGRNEKGQLGDGTDIPRSSPIQVGLLTNWKEVACGNRHNAAIKTDGTLWTWGDNYNGQLGDGTIANKSSPIQVGALTNWKKVFCGNRHTMAIKTDGTLWACGYNWYGTLGDGTNIDKSSPVQIGTLTDWNYVSCGYGNFSAIKTDGTLWACGYNIYGALGDGTVVNKSSPVQIGTLNNWIDVSCGYSHSISIQTAQNSTKLALPQLGGTGKTTIEDARLALLPPITGKAGKILSTDGTNARWVDPITLLP